LSGENNLETIQVSKDFYPPVHKVEVHPLTVTATAEGTEDGTTTDDTGTSTDGSTGSTDGSGTSTDNSTGTDTGDGSTGSGDGTSGNGTPTGGTGTGTGDDDNNGENTQPHYDKGGEVVPSSKE